MNTLRKKLILGFLCFVMVFAIVMSSGKTVYAQEAFVGEIIMVAFNFCPNGYAEANGQLLPISEHTALFSLLGTIYGGDGQTNFALPDLRGRTPVNIGQGSGLSDNIALGQKGGAEQVTLTVNQLPSHYHNATTTVNVDTTLRGTNSVANADAPGGNVLAAQKAKKDLYGSGSADVDMGATSIESAATAETIIGDTGGNQPVGVRSPYLGIRYCIALYGIYPSQ